MPIPSSPIFTQIPNNLSELLKIGNNNYKFLSKGLTNITKITNLTSKRVKEVAKVVNTVKKTAQNAKTVTDNLKKGNYKQVNPGMANAINFALSFASIGLSLLTINHIGNLQEIQLKKEGIIQKDLNIAFQKFVTNNLTIKELRKEFNKFKSRYDEDKGRLLNQVQESFKNSVDGRELSEKAKKQANDALYEAREGRKKVEAKISEINSNYQQITNDQQQLVADIASQNLELNNRIEESRKIGNDALYETREGRRKLESEINTKFQAARQLANNALYEVRAGRSKIEANFGQQLNSLRTTVSNQLRSSEAKTAQQVKSLFAGSQNIINNVVAEARAAQTQAQTAQSQAQSLQKKVNQNQAEINRLKQRDLGSSLQKLVNNSIAISPQIQALLAALKAANVKLDGFDLGLNSIRKVYGSAINELQTNVQIVDGRITKVERGVEIKGLNIVNARISGLESGIENNKQNIKKIDTQIREREFVDKIALSKIDQILGLIPLIPARAAGLVKPSPGPSFQKLESAASSAICKSSRPGGCMNKGLKDATNNVNQNTNNWGKNLFDKINAGANAAQLALLKKLDVKLGPQLPGGISTVLKNFYDGFKSVAKWLHIDRALNVLTFAATVHNATQLSSNIVQTLASALSNGLSLIGIKDDKGNALNISELVNGTIQNTIKGIVGEQNYVSMSENWAKANRIYQSTTNVLNAFQGLSSAILTGLEMTAGKVGKIGNALRDAGEVLENAYGWMNPQPKFNRIIQSLESLQNGASTIQQVTQAPLEIIEASTELTNATTELTKAIKEDDKPENKGKESPEPDKLKDDKIASKEASKGLELFDIDFDFDI